MEETKSVHPYGKGCDAFLYLYQPCLLSLALFAWANDGTGENRNRPMILGSLLCLALSEAETGGTYLSLYPAALLLPAPFLPRKGECTAWPETLVAAFLGGLLCWKAADVWPLLPGSMLLCGMLLPLPACLLCRNRSEALLAISLGSILFELFFCLREYMLFSFCVVRLGSRGSLSLGALSLLLLQLSSLAYPLLTRKGNEVPSMEF